MVANQQIGHFNFTIQQGSHFHHELLVNDINTGEPFDFTADPDGDWTARAEVRDIDGTLIAAFATTGEDGVITLDADGILALDLAAEFTANLTPTAGYGGTNVSGPVFADIKLTDPADSEPWTWFAGNGHIAKEVTSNG